MLQRLDLADRIELEPAPEPRVDGFAERHARPARARALAAAAGVEPRWRAPHRRSGSRSRPASAAAAPTPRRRSRLANETLAEPLPPSRLHELAARLGADVPFFLDRRARSSATGDGTRARAARPAAGLLGRARSSRDGARKHVDGRRLRGLRRARRRGRASTSAAQRCSTRSPRSERPRDLAALPPNDLASSPLADELRALGAFRADVTGAGPGGLRALPAPRRRRVPRGARCARSGPDLAHGSCLVRLSAMAHRVAAAIEHRARSRDAAAGCAPAGCGSRSGSRSSRASLVVLDGDLAAGRSIASRSLVIALYLVLAAERAARTRSARSSWIAAASQALVALVVAILVASSLIWRRRCSLLVGDLRGRRALSPDSSLTARLRAAAVHSRRLPSLGRSQVVRQRVLVPRSQVRILAPQPSSTPMTDRTSQPSSWPAASARACARRRRSTCTRCSAGAWSTGCSRRRAALGADPLVVVASPETRDAFDGRRGRRPGASRAAPATPSRAARAALDGFDGDVLVLSGDTPLLTPELLRELVETHRASGAAATVLSFEPPTRARTAASSATPTARLAARSSRRATRRRSSSRSREVNSSIYVFAADKLWPALERLEPAERAGRALPDRHRSRILVDGRRARRRPRRARPDRGRGRQHARRARRRRRRAARPDQRGAHARRRRRSSTRRRPGSSRTSSSSRTRRSTRSRSCAAARGSPRAPRSARTRSRSTPRSARVRSSARSVTFAPERCSRRARRPARSWRSRTRTSATRTKVPHLSYIGDAEIGEDTNIARRQHHRELPAPAGPAEGPDDDRPQRQDRRPQCVRCSGRRSATTLGSRPDRSSPRTSRPGSLAASRARAGEQGGLCRSKAERDD